LARLPSTELLLGAALGEGSEVGKVKPYSRRRLIGLRRAWIKRNAGLVAALGIGVVVLLVAVTALLLFVGERSPLHWYLLGVAHAGLIGAGLHLLNSAFLTVDRDAIVASLIVV